MGDSTNDDDTIEKPERPGPDATSKEIMIWMEQIDDYYAEKTRKQRKKRDEGESE